MNIRKDCNLNDRISIHLLQSQEFEFVSKINLKNYIMSIKPRLLHSVGATEQHFYAGDYIFREDGTPQFYYQILEGEVKLNNYSNEGKEFIQNILPAGNCFGESMLFLEKPYPVNAVALSNCTVLKICREKFLTLLDIYPHIALDICNTLSEKTYNKFILMRKISSKNAI